MVDPGQYGAHVKKQSQTSVAILVVALCLTFLVAVGAALGGIYLYFQNNSQRDRIAQLQADLASVQGKAKTVDGTLSDLGDRLDAMKTSEASDVSDLKSKFTLVTSDVTTAKGDISDLKAKANVAAPKFILSDFNLSFDGNLANIDYYYGTGTVSCGDLSANYFTLLKATLKSGGTPGSSTTDYFWVTVSNGSGKFYTTDYNAKGKLVKPDYSFEVVGYVKVSGVK